LNHVAKSRRIFGDILYIQGSSNQHKLAMR
jgi:hypothetical protein